MAENPFLSSTPACRMTTTTTKTKTKTVSVISSIAVIAIAGLIIAAMSVSVSITFQPNNVYAQKNIVSRSCINAAVATFKTSVNNAIAEFIKGGSKDTLGFQSSINASQATLQKQLQSCL